MGSEAPQRDSVSLEEIVERDPTSALYLPHAERLLRRGMIAEAVRLCEERRTRPGRGVGDHIVLGRCYLADGRLAEARREFQSALDLDRENVAALKSLAGIFSHEGRHGEAADLYRAVCRVDPGDLESQTALHQITSGDFPEVRPAEVVVDQGSLSWQPIRLTREEDHLPELALGLRTLESHEAESLRPSVAAGDVTGSTDAGAPAVVDEAVAAPHEETILTPEDLERSLSFPSAPAAAGPAPSPTPGALERSGPPDAFQDRLGGLDVEAFQESALERLETAIRPVPVRTLGEVEPAEAPTIPTGMTPAPAMPVPPAPPVAAAPTLPAAPAPPVPPAPPAPAAAPEMAKPGAKGNRAAFETWLRNLGGGGGGGGGS